MSKMFLFASLSIFVAIGLILTGCSNEQPSQQPSPETPQATGHEGHDHEGHEGHEHQDGDHAGHSEYDKELSKLSADDRALAEKQKICPVTGQPLGSMGKPYKVTVNDRVVFLCCQGCEGKIKDNPEKYLAKLPK